MSTSSQTDDEDDFTGSAGPWTDGPEPLPADHPNLKLAATRLQRIQWVWASLFAGMAVLSWMSIGGAYPLAALPWLLGAALLATLLQPALLALVALQWALSLGALIPGLAVAFGPDPISQVFSGGTIETVGRAAVRVVMAVVAWNQFIFYRMLYGTSGTVGLPEDLRPIPEVVDNRSNAFATASAITGGASVLLSVASLSLSTSTVGHMLVQLAYHGAVFAVGLGLGAAFSPTSLRRRALLGVGLGILAFLGSLAAGRLVLA